MISATLSLDQAYPVQPVLGVIEPISSAMKSSLDLNSFTQTEEEVLNPQKTEESWKVGSQMNNTFKDMESSHPNVSHPRVRFDYSKIANETIFEELREVNTPLEFLDIENNTWSYFQPYLTPIYELNEPFKSIEYTLYHKLDDIVQYIYPDAKEELSIHPWWYYYYFLRWSMNLIFIGLPWAGISLWFCLMNAIINIYFNEWWGYGHPILLINTIYLYVQTAVSIPLMLEIPWWMHHMKYIRLISFTFSWWYLIFYFVVVVQWVIQIYFLPNNLYENEQWIDILYNMILAYLTVFHLHIIPVNFLIWMKEITMEIFPPLLDQDLGDNLDLEDLRTAFSIWTYYDLLTKGEFPDAEHHTDYEFKVDGYKDGKYDPETDGDHMEV